MAIDWEWDQPLNRHLARQVDGYGADERLYVVERVRWDPSPVRVGWRARVGHEDYRTLGVWGDVTQAMDAVERHEAAEVQACPRR